MKRRLLTMLGFLAGLGAIALYFQKLLPWINNLGASESEQNLPFPTDDEIPPTTLLQQNTRAVTIDAPPEAVWPWIVQMGRDYSGWYSCDWLDNQGVPSADKVRSDLSPLQVGDQVQDLTVTQLEPGEYVCYAVHEHSEPLTLGTVIDASFTYWLQPLSVGRTRLLQRTRLASPGPPALSAQVWLALRLNEIVEFISLQKQLKQLKWLVETYPQRYPKLASERTRG